MIETIIKKYETAVKETSRKVCIYIDFPFCESKCTYCIYKSSSFYNRKDIVDKYKEAVFNQLDSFSEIFHMCNIDSIYFGGGTASLWEESDLIQIKGKIHNYDGIATKKSEAHPNDLTNERIDFYAKEMLLDVISIGVQTLNRQSCLGQNRIWISKERIKEIVEAFHNHGVRVNIDLVALFNGDREEDWKIYTDDLMTTCLYIKPDSITTIPNYKTKLVYLDQIPRFRTILKEVCDMSGYKPINQTMLSLDSKDIYQYGYNDHYIATADFWKYNNSHFRYCSSSPKNGNQYNQITMAFGGFEEHKIYGYANGDEIYYSYYDINTDRIVYEERHSIK